MNVYVWSAICVICIIVTSVIVSSKKEEEKRKEVEEKRKEVEEMKKGHEAKMIVKTIEEEKMMTEFVNKLSYKDSEIQGLNEKADALDRLFRMSDGKIVSGRVDNHQMNNKLTLSCEDENTKSVKRGNNKIKQGFIRYGKWNDPSILPVSTYYDLSYDLSCIGDKTCNVGSMLDKIKENDPFPNVADKQYEIYYTCEKGTMERYEPSLGRSYI